MPKVLVPLAQGCEELEAVTIIDLLRRANFEVVTTGLDTAHVVASRGVVLVPDTDLESAAELDDLDMIVLPGGLPGADNLAGSTVLTALLKRMHAEGKYIAAICAAPRVLAKLGILDGKTVTAYPGFINAEDFPEVRCTGGRVERDGNVITSRGPGTAMDFALTLIEILGGEKTRHTVETGLVR
ncbi:MAG: DJ-1/PfpI family protein [Candidatus Hydrogenedentes bacterium]|nr:DJ-1/PfpI family protein [Candidatus Hydrogenedentota bacterium]